MTRDKALTHDEIYERLYAVWLQLPACDGKTFIGGLIADLESEPEPSPCACGGKEPLAVVEALAEQITETGECFVGRHGGLHFFANIPALLPNMDKCDLLQRPIRILVFDDLPGEEP